MAVFKRKRSGTNGKTETDGVWTVQIADHAGIRRRIPGFASRAASTELERNIRKLISIRQAGGSLDAESNRFLETAPVAVRDKLATWGIIEGARAAAGKGIAEHIEDWKAALEAKGNCDEHNKGFVGNLKRVIAECNWRLFSNISATDMTNWINTQKAGELAAATINHHIRAAKAFCRWMLKAKRTTENPLAHIPMLNADADRRIERHPYSLEELGSLLAAAEAGPIVNGMRGPVRALLYRTATETGLRWSELRSLARSSFDFDSDPATVTIAASDAKNGLCDILPLRSELAADLKAHMSCFLPAAKAFPGMWKKRGAEMIRADLEAAGVLSRNSEGELTRTDEFGLVYDFHGLRHTFATMLNKAKVPLATAQKLMRHSDPKLTAKIYTHVMVDTKAEAIGLLPEIAASAPESERAAKTGTDDASFLQVGNSMDTSMDTFALDFDGEIWSYMESEKQGKAPFSGRVKTRKSPVSQGDTGPFVYGDHDGTRTRNLQIDSLVL